MSRLNSGYHLYYNRGTQRYSAVFRTNSGNFMYTRWSYYDPSNALLTIYKKKNTNNVSNGNTATINRWLRSKPLNKVNINQYMTQNIQNAASILRAMKRR